MPNIEFCGFTYSKASNMKTLLDELMKKIGLQEDAVSRRPRHQSGQVGGDLVETCDNKRQEQPFIRLWSSEIFHILKILSAFQENKEFHLDIEYPNALTPSGLYYFPAEDIASGQWRSKFGIKNVVALKDIDAITGELINMREPNYKGILEYFGYQFIVTHGSGFRADISPVGSYDLYFEELKKLVVRFVEEGKNFCFQPYFEKSEAAAVWVDKYDESVWSR